jgi:hypothetical protein
VAPANTDNGFGKLPEGYVAIPVAKDQESALLKICVLIRSEAEVVGGHLVVLRDTVDAKAFLGCIVDRSDRVHEWLEIWIQNSGGLVDTAPAARQALSNAMLDDRWRRQCRAFEELDEGAIIRTGWEFEHPLPTFLDLSESSPVHPVDPACGSAWKLCTDEGLLQQKDLPGYAGSLYRYLYQPSLGADSQLVPVTAGAPTNAFTKALSEISGDPGQVVQLNLSAGFMLVKKHLPIGFETFIDILSGAPWDGLKHGRSVLELGEQVTALGKHQTALARDGRLFLETRGRGGRVVESFHLKLCLLADVLSSVHSMVGRLQRPLLNISPEGWQIKLGEPGRGLPFFWTAKAVLSDPGDAIPLPIEGSDLRYFAPLVSSGTSVYRPLVSSLATKGQASVRIRQVLPDTRDTTAVEGTFATQERLEMGKHDLVWFRLNLACGEINLYAHLEADSAMAAGEWRFRTVAQKIDETEVSHLRSAEGVPMSEVPFEIIPLLSSPCDLYSVAVLALRTLLVDNVNSLPVVVDEALSLSRQICSDGDASTGPAERIEDIFHKDPRWVESLGPQHLTFDEMTPDEAFGFVPAELWWTLLGIIVRMFPGSGSDSECKDFGDARQGGLHKVFERTISDLDNLIVRSRSLIVADWESNLEISAVIGRYLI